LNSFASADAIEPKSYILQLVALLKSGLPLGEGLLELLPNFEELLIKLKKGKERVVEKTSHLMTLRLLEFGREANKFSSSHLTKKKYSLKVIDLRRRYGNISELIGFVTELYKDAKFGLVFLKELSELVNGQLAIHPFSNQRIQELLVRADDLCSKRNDTMRILDGLISAIAVEHPRSQ
jgi:hypothetical protein